MKTVYVMRTRLSDNEPWSEPQYFKTRKERDEIGAMNRMIGGIRTNSWEEKRTPEEIEQLCAQEI